MTDLIAREQAELEFEAFTEAMDLKVDVSNMDATDKADFGAMRETVLDAICVRSLTFSDDHEPIFTPQRSGNTDPITFYEPTGEALAAMDRKKEGANVAKFYASMAVMTKQSHARFVNMKKPDLNVCMAVAGLFLA